MLAHSYPKAILTELFFKSIGRTEKVNFPCRPEIWNVQGIYCSLKVSIFLSFHPSTSSICLDSSVMNEIQNGHQMHNFCMYSVNKIFASYMKSHKIIMEGNMIPQVKK